jgi:cytoskeletal protein CcmA (bactofilin family)
MFTRKPEDGNGGQSASKGGESKDSGGAGKLPLRSRAPSDVPPTLPARSGGPRPEIVRRARDYGGRPGDDRNVSSFGGNSDSKQLIVGRDIALSGEISSCEKLVVEGRVEANITECSELDIAEPGTFKGEATIDIAVISGRFEGTLVVRDLLIVHSTGRINGSVRYGQIEIERGGQLQGDIRMIGDATGPAGEDAS